MTASTVAPDHILKELADLWLSLGKQSDGDQSAGVLRACSMTLVTITDDSDDVMSLGETIAALMPEHPARAIVLRMREGGDAALAARVFAQCWMPFGQRRQICCEQVEITAADRNLPELPPLVLPLCVPDLPVMLWCRSGRLLALPAFRQLASIARKVILDSASLPDPKAALSDIAALAAGGTLVGDLSWTRLTRWRETLARLFDNREYYARIPELTAIQVCHGGAVQPPSARYMAAWLVNALGDAGRAVEVKLQADPNARAGEVSSVHVTGTAPEALHITLVVKQDCLTVRVGEISNRTMLPRASEYQLMREELGIVTRDPIFDRTLSSAAAIAVSSEGK